MVTAAELECSSLDGSSMMLGESGETIPGFSHARIRLHFKPREIGQYTMEVVLRNLNDARNRETVGVHALVTSQPQHAGLLVGGNGLLDFGDCYASAATRQLLVVRNISDEALDVHFSSDLPDEVSFDLLGEEEGSAASRERRGWEVERPRTRSSHSSEAGPTATATTRRARWRCSMLAALRDRACDGSRSCR